MIYVDFNAYLKLQPQSSRPSALGKSLPSAEAFTFLLFVHFLPVLSLPHSLPYLYNAAAPERFPRMWLAFQDGFALA